MTPAMFVRKNTDLSEEGKWSTCSYQWTTETVGACRAFRPLTPCTCHPRRVEVVHATQRSFDTARDPHIGENLHLTDVLLEDFLGHYQFLTF